MLVVAKEVNPLLHGLRDVSFQLWGVLAVTLIEGARVSLQLVGAGRLVSKGLQLFDPEGGVGAFKRV